MYINVRVILVNYRTYNQIKCLLYLLLLVVVALLRPFFHIPYTEKRKSTPKRETKKKKIEDVLGW